MTFIVDKYNIHTHIYLVTCVFYSISHNFSFNKSYKKWIRVIEFNKIIYNKLVNFWDTKKCIPILKESLFGIPESASRY